MNFSIGMGSTLAIGEVGVHARAAEEAGFTHLTLVDTPTMARDVHVMMMTAAEATDRIRIGQGVVDPLSIHPTVIANLSASINEIAPGRIFVGLGTGNAVAKGRKPATLRELRDAVHFIRRFTTGEEASYQGVTYRSRWSRTQLPVYVSAHGPRSLQVAGEIADGVIFIATHPAYVGWQLAMIERGARGAGRDMAEIDTWARTMIYVTKDREVAKREVSSYPTSYKDLHLLLSREDPDVDRLRDALESDEPGSVEALINDSRRYAEAFDPRYAELLGAPHAAAVSWRLIDFWHLCGSAEQIRERVEELGAIGVKTISTTVYTVADPLAMIRSVGEEVIARGSD